MTSKVVVLKRNAGDDAKLQQLTAINPIKLIEYSNGAQLAGFKNDLGKIDYLLVTGGHGDFQNRKPSKFNDADIVSTRTWIKNLKGTFKAIILDTCFSCALAGMFTKFLPNGGCLVCAYGTGEGWTIGFSSANGANSVGSILSTVVDGSADLGSAMNMTMVSSIGVLIKKPTTYQLLYTSNAGATRGENLQSRTTFGMEADTEQELKEVDLYLRRDLVNVTPTDDATLKKLLNDSLTMTVV
jgi:hypothetical protein